MKVSFEFDPVTKVVTNLTVDNVAVAAPAPAQALPLYTLLPGQVPGYLAWARIDGTQVAVPTPGAGEGIMSYAARVSAETGYPANAVGAFAQGIASTTPFGDGGDISTWPLIVDFLADPRKYMTVDQRAQYDAMVTKSWAGFFQGSAFGQP